MATIAVFDSGLGSLSIVRAIREISKCDIVYYADTRSHPYGTKPPRRLQGIVLSTIGNLRERFDPNLVVVGSNTPTLVIDGLEDDATIGVWPPLSEAAGLSSAGHVAVLATKAVVNRSVLGRYARSCSLPKGIRVTGVDASALVELVETGRFLRDPESCRQAVRTVLDRAGDADVCTLSSTHLPFLRGMFERERPVMTFLDPARSVARRAVRMVGGAGDGTLRVFTSGGHDVAANLRMLGVEQEVTTLRFGPSGSRG